MFISVSLWLTTSTYLELIPCRCILKLEVTSPAYNYRRSAEVRHVQQGHAGMYRRGFYEEQEEQPEVQ